MKKGLIILGAIIVIAIFVIINLKREGSKVEVYATDVGRRNVTKTVSASGSIQPKRQVNVSASAIGKITKLAVREGDTVKTGDFLLQIDPTTYQSAVDQLEASIGAAGGTLEMEQANLQKAEYDLERVKALFEQELVSEEELRTAKLNVDVYRARVKSARESLSQHRANLTKAQHDLREVRITADMSGTITALNVEEGENAIMGTLNNPGTVLLTIADLSEIEAEVLVDETEVVYVKVGQEASVSLDAYPDTSFTGEVVEVGNSAVRSQVGLGQTSVDFEVVVAVRESIPSVRPGLSANVKIDVAEVVDALSIPIECLTVRRSSEIEPPSGEPEEPRDGEEMPAEDDQAEKDEYEGVFVIEDGKAEFRPVTTGIAGGNYFHVVRGLKEGETVVSGPFKAINELRDGDAVEVVKKPSS
ncbi:MAG: efflux RND transporter periplasmic adaptor subunit [Candidatus Latescibacterota bacterium]|nr:MAG: efflux RND transporter periplasmic adaptor subunit [Candidatus Latescibacterota bacterium]